MGTGYGVVLSVIGWGERGMSLWGLMWIMEPGIMLLVEWVMLPLDPDYLSGVFCCNQCTRLPPAFIPTKAPSHPSLPPKPTRGIHCPTRLLTVQMMSIYPLQVPLQWCGVFSYVWVSYLILFKNKHMYRYNLYVSLVRGLKSNVL